jgi:hypothetical protein
MIWAALARPRQGLRFIAVSGKRGTGRSPFRARGLVMARPAGDRRVCRWGWRPRHRRLGDVSGLTQFDKLKMEIAKVVEDADYPLDLWRDLRRFEAPLWDLERSDYDMHAGSAGGRNDIDQSRDRKMFARRMFRYLDGACGELIYPPEMVN